MNMLHLLADCIVHALLQSLAAGACCYLLLIAFLRLFPELPAGGKYLLSNAAQLLVAAAFMHPFMLAAIQHAPAAVDAAQRPAVVQFSVIEAAPHLVHTDPAASVPVADTKPVWEPVLLFLEGHAALVLQVYMLGLLFFMLRLIAACYGTLRLRRHGLIAPDADWQEHLEAVSRTLKLRRKVRLAFSSIVQTPCIIGWARAIVLIPVSLATRLSPAQAEALLMHELAHYRHYHYYINLAGQVALTFQFFNPFVWLIQARSARYREYVSDDVAAKHAMQLALAESLVIIAAQRASSNTLALSLQGRRSQLYHRIQNLLQMNQQASNTKTALITTCVALLLALCGFSQLSAVPVRVRDTDTLASISRIMHRQGNPNFILVEAIRDSLIRMNSSYVFKYEDGWIYIDKKPLAEPAQSRYLAMFRSLDRNKGVSMWSVSGDGITANEVFDPGSSFRRMIEDVRSKSVSFTPFETVKTPDPVKPQSSGDSKLLLKTLLSDRIIDSAGPVFIDYLDDVLTVNGKVLNGNRKKKYLNILKDFDGFSNDTAGPSNLKIYPEGVMAPSIANGNSKIQFPRHPGHKPYSYTLPASGIPADPKIYHMLRAAVAADDLADTTYTVHLVFNTKGIFVNDVKLEGAKDQKYRAMLLEQFRFSLPKQESDLVDMTF